MQLFDVRDLRSRFISINETAIHRTREYFSALNLLFNNLLWWFSNYDYAQGSDPRLATTRGKLQNRRCKLNQVIRVGGNLLNGRVGFVCELRQSEQNSNLEKQLQNFFNNWKLLFLSSEYIPSGTTFNKFWKFFHFQLPTDVCFVVQRINHIAVIRLSYAFPVQYPQNPSWRNLQAARDREIHYEVI